jgi:uncharacterized protein YndB with AHSA1/START domain
MKGSVLYSKTLTTITGLRDRKNNSSPLLPAGKEPVNHNFHLKSNSMNATIEFRKLPKSRQIIIKHRYQHPPETLWNAFTQTEMLEKWWAPEPYKAIVVSNNFEKGGKLHYYMLSPTGEKHYCIVEFLEIDPLRSYEMLDAFCDENGLINTGLPKMKWLNSFNFQNGMTTVTNAITFEKSEDMEKILEMGFEEGYRTGLNQLYDVLDK